MMFFKNIINDIISSMGYGCYKYANYADKIIIRCVNKSDVY